MKCKLSLVAKEIIIAHDTGVPSAINLLEGIHAASFPVLFHEISFLTVWTKEEGDKDQQEGHLVVECSGKELLREKIEIAFGARSVVRNVASFKGLVLPEPGDLVFRCEFPTASASYNVAVMPLAKVETKATIEG